MGINVEVDQAITSGKSFTVTLSVNDGEDVATCDMTVSVNGVPRSFVVKPPVPVAPAAKTQTLDVEDQNDHTVSNWGTGNQGDNVEVTVKEQAPGTRTGSSDGAIV